MAWHNRHIITKNGTPSGLRTSVVFIRQDLLWAPDEEIRNPYARRSTVRIPVAKVGTKHQHQPIYMGPNILDLVIREERMVPAKVEEEGVDEDEPQTDAEEETAIYWCLRDPSDFFVPPKQRKTQGSPEHPFRKRLCTGGKFCGYEDGFIVVEKKSSVSVSALVYKLAAGMLGSSLAASNRIGTLAASAWEQDMLRAKTLYDLVKVKGEVMDDEVPMELKASATVSQEVESAILRDACAWLGVDPDKPIDRRKGRPKGKRGGNSQAGQVIELTLETNSSVTGRLIQSYAGWPQNTILAALTLVKLAELLVALRDDELIDDADLLEAYLLAVDPNWKDTIAEEVGLSVSSGLPDDPWTLLGIEQDTDEEEIKKAYRKLMRAVHPDTNGLPDWISKIVIDAYKSAMEGIDNG